MHTKSCLFLSLSAIAMGLANPIAPQRNSLEKRTAGNTAVVVPSNMTLAKFCSEFLISCEMSIAATSILYQLNCGSTVPSQASIALITCIESSNVDASVVDLTPLVINFNKWQLVHPATVSSALVPASSIARASSATAAATTSYL